MSDSDHMNRHHLLPFFQSKTSGYFLTSVASGYFWFISGYVLTLIPRPPRARDHVTMVEDGPAPGRVTAGVGSVSWGAGTESNSSDRSVQPTLRFGSESISITSNYRQITY